MLWIICPILWFEMIEHKLLSHQQRMKEKVLFYYKNKRKLYIMVILWSYMVIYYENFYRARVLERSRLKNFRTWFRAAVNRMMVNLITSGLDDNQKNSRIPKISAKSNNIPSYQKMIIINQNWLLCANHWSKPFLK